MHLDFKQSALRKMSRGNRIRGGGGGEDVDVRRI